MYQYNIWLDSHHEAWHAWYLAVSKMRLGFITRHGMVGTSLVPRFSPSGLSTCGTRFIYTREHVRTSKYDIARGVRLLLGKRSVVYTLVTYSYPLWPCLLGEHSQDKTVLLFRRRGTYNNNATTAHR